MPMTKTRIGAASLASLIAIIQFVPATAAQGTPPVAPEATPATPAEIGSASAPAPAEIIVTAQRRAETLERTPVAVTAISSQALARQAIVSTSDLQIAVPGLTVKAGRRRTSSPIRFVLVNNAGIIGPVAMSADLDEEANARVCAIN